MVLGRKRLSQAKVDQGSVKLLTKKFFNSLESIETRMGIPRKWGLAGKPDKGPAKRWVVILCCVPNE